MSGGFVIYINVLIASVKFTSPADPDLSGGSLRLVGPAPLAWGLIGDLLEAGVEG